MGKNTRHGSYYINVGQVLGVVGAFIIALKYASVFEKNPPQININGDTIKHVADEIGRTARWVL